MAKVLKMNIINKNDVFTYNAPLNLLTFKITSQAMRQQNTLL